MNLLVVTHFYGSHRGGIELVAERLNAVLARRGWDVEWAASDVTEAPEGLAPGLRPLPMRANNFAEAKLGFPFPLWAPSALGRLWRAVGRADAVHLHDSLYPGNACAFVFASLRGRPVLVTQHIGDVPYKSPVLRGLLKVANATLARTVLGRADQVVFVGDQVRDFFARRVRFRAPPRLIMNGVDLGLFSPEGTERDRDAMRRELGIGLDAPLFLFVGRFVEKKGLGLLRALAERMPGAAWVFAGWGPMDPEGWALPHVKVRHHCAAPELARLYRAADLLVLPSVGEGFPLVVQEAMACGTPALVGEETARACPDAGGLLLSEDVSRPGAGERWARRLEALAADRAALASLRPRVARFAAEHWSWERCASEYEACLRALIEARGGETDVSAGRRP